jgi:hypothetical protein
MRIELISVWAVQLLAIFLIIKNINKRNYR